MNKTPIQVGDRVRSYDFPDLPGMKTTCYAEGIVEAIGPVPGVGGCDRYTIRIERRIWQRKEDEKWKDGREFPTGRCYPPVNGIPTSLGGITKGVEVLPPDAPPVPPPQEPPPVAAAPQEPPAAVPALSATPLTWGQLTPNRKAVVTEFEKHLRTQGWPYVAVTDAKKAIFGAAEMKSFDFLVYSSTGANLLVLIVTRRPTPEQTEFMREWEKVFGQGFLAAFTFQTSGQRPATSGAEWRLISLADLQQQDPLGHSRPVADCLS